MMVSMNLGLAVLCEPEYPEAWRTEPYYSQLLKLAGEGAPIRIWSGECRFWLNADGTTEPD
jgi:hypothetical protein